MQPLEIIIGVLLIIAAIFCVIGAVVEETVILFGIAIVCAIGGAWSLNHGWHGENAKFHAKHEAILADLTKQGFQIKTDDVSAKDGPYLSHTEVDITVGRCVFPFYAKHINGVWRLMVVGSAQNVEYTSLTAADVAKLAAVCPSKKG